MATFNWSGGRSHPLGCRKRGKRGFRTWRLQREKIICRWIIGISENLCINFFKYRHFRHLSSFLFPFLTLLFVFCYLPPPWITLVFSGEVYSWHLIRFLPGGDVIFRIIQSHFFPVFPYVVSLFLGWLWWFVSSQRRMLRLEDCWIPFAQRITIRSLFLVSFTLRCAMVSCDI